MDMAIGVNHVMRSFPEKERQTGGICCPLLEAAICVSARIAESHQPFMRNSNELLQQANFHLTATEQLIVLAQMQGYLSYTEWDRMHDICLELRGLIFQEMHA